MVFRRGDVILVRFPYSDLKHFKMRPALVVQDEAVETGSDERLAVQITSNLARASETRILVRRDSQQGREMHLLADSVIVVDHVATVTPREISTRSSVAAGKWRESIAACAGSCACDLSRSLAYL